MSSCLGNRGLDQMRNVLASPTYDRYMMDGESDEWINWDKRPLTTEIANLIISWSESAIDEALGAEEVSRRTVKGGARRLQSKGQEGGGGRLAAPGRRSKRSAAEIEAEKNELEEALALQALSVEEEEEEEETTRSDAIANFEDEPI